MYPLPCHACANIVQERCTLCLGILMQTSGDEMQCFLSFIVAFGPNSDIHNASVCFSPLSRISSCDAVLTVNLPINVRGPQNAESVKWLVIFRTYRPTQIYPLRKEKALNVLVIFCRLS